MPRTAYTCWPTACLNLVYNTFGVDLHALPYAYAQVGSLSAAIAIQLILSIYAAHSVVALVYCATVPPAPVPTPAPDARDEREDAVIGDDEHDQLLNLGGDVRIV